MYQYAFVGYMVWKYLYLLEYGYNAYHYGKYIAKFFQKHPQNEWILLDNLKDDDPVIIVEKI